MVTQIEKEGIIAEYLTTEISYRELGKKTGVDFRTLHQWVRTLQGKVKYGKKDKKKESIVDDSNELLPKEVNMV